MSTDAQGEATVAEAIAERRRLFTALDTASALAPIAGRDRADATPGLATRLVSRLRYGAASLFTARQKRFNLEITEAVRQLAASVDRLAVAQSGASASLTAQLQQSTARLTELVEAESVRSRADVAALAGMPAEAIEARLAEVTAHVTALVAAEEARARADVSAHTTGVLVQLDELRLNTEPPHFRPGTWDHLIWSGIVRGIEYELPAVFDPRDVVIDVGAHIGSFSFTCLARGAGKVYGFEAHPHNHAVAATNVSRFGSRGEVFNKAMWRSDEPPGVVKFVASSVRENTGAGNVLPSGVTYHYTDKDWVEIPSVCFDDFLGELPERVGRPDARVRMLKMDCEGSEYPILLTSKKLHLVDEIVGEFHEAAEYPDEPTDAAKGLGVRRLDRYTLRHYLEEAGFTVKLTEAPGCSTLGHFHAVRKAG